MYCPAESGYIFWPKSRILQFIFFITLHRKLKILTALNLNQLMSGLSNVELIQTPGNI